jgi:hypothetical protein
MTRSSHHQEALEPRRLLAVTLASNGAPLWTGSAADDVVTIHRDSETNLVCTE